MNKMWNIFDNINIKNKYKNIEQYETCRYRRSGAIKEK